MRALIGGMVVTALAVGCGGGGEPMTRTAFRHEVSRACERANARFDELPGIQLPVARSTASDIARYIDVSERMLSDLRALVPPKRDTSMVDKWIAVLEQFVSELQHLREAVRSGRTSDATEVMSRVVQLVMRGVELARESGIVACHPPLDVPSS